MQSVNMKLTLVALFLCFDNYILQAQQYAPNWQSLDQRKLPAWFQQDKFGIFIHLGLYAVPSYSLVSHDGYSEWYWCKYNDSDRYNHKAVKSFQNEVYRRNFGTSSLPHV